MRYNINNLISAVADYSNMKDTKPSMKKQKISDAVIHRLPRYYRYLDDLYNKGVVRISSSLLGSKMDITASQIRQDLSCFGEFGQQGYGYNVAELRAEIGHILGIDNGHKLIIVGAGHLGHALLQNFDFKKVGFQIDTAFDVSPALVGTKIHDVVIRSMDELEDYVNQEKALDKLFMRCAAADRPAYRAGHPRVLELHERGALVLCAGRLFRKRPLRRHAPHAELPHLPSLSAPFSPHDILWTETCEQVNLHRRSHYVQSGLLGR